MTAESWVLLITAFYFPNEAACERAKVLTVPGEVVQYQCIEATPQATEAPQESPLPPRKPARGDG